MVDQRVIPVKDYGFVDNALIEALSSVDDKYDIRAYCLVDKDGRKLSIGTSSINIPKYFCRSIFIDSFLLTMSVPILFLIGFILFWWLWLCGTRWDYAQLFLFVFIFGSFFVSAFSFLPVGYVLSWFRNHRVTIPMDALRNVSDGDVFLVVEYTRPYRFQVIRKMAKPLYRALQFMIAGVSWIIGVHVIFTLILWMILFTYYSNNVIYKSTELIAQKLNAVIPIGMDYFYFDDGTRQRFIGNFTHDFEARINDKSRIDSLVKDGHTSFSQTQIGQYTIGCFESSAPLDNQGYNECYVSFEPVPGYVCSIRTGQIPITMEDIDTTFILFLGPQKISSGEFHEVYGSKLDCQEKLLDYATSITSLLGGSTESR